MEKMRKKKREKDAVEAERQAQVTVHREMEEALEDKRLEMARDSERVQKIHREELELREKRCNDRNAAAEIALAEANARKAEVENEKDELAKGWAALNIAQQSYVVTTGNDVPSLRGGGEMRRRR